MDGKKTAVFSRDPVLYQQGPYHRGPYLRGLSGCLSSGRILVLSAAPGTALCQPHAGAAPLSTGIENTRCASARRYRGELRTDYRGAAKAAVGRNILLGPAGTSRGGAGLAPTIITSATSSTVLLPGSWPRRPAVAPLTTRLMAGPAFHPLAGPAARRRRYGVFTGECSPGWIHKGWITKTGSASRREGRWRRQSTHSGFPTAARSRSAQDDRNAAL